MVVEEWHADIEITEKLVQQSIQEQFPSLSPIEKIERIGEGWDNTAFLINKKIIFRFPRRESAVELIENENKLLKNLPSIVSLEIPHLKYMGQATLSYPYPFHGYEMIKGISACHTHLNMKDRIASLTPLAFFLKQLHSIDATRALAIGAEYQTYDRTDSSKATRNLIERVNKIITRKFCHINEEIFQQEIKIAQGIKLSPQKCLTHGDLDARHLIFDQDQLIGIIDWGDAGIHHKSLDLRVIWNFYPSNCHEKFFEIYGEVDPNTWQYARFLGLYSSLTLILYGHDIGDDLLVKEAVESVERINPSLLEQ